MIRLKRPFIFGMNNGNVSILANGENLATIEPQGYRDVDLKPGKYTFEVESKWFKGKSESINVKEGDLIEIKSKIGSYWVIAFVATIVLPQILYVFQDSFKMFLYIGLPFGIILAILPYLPIFANKAYTVEKITK